MTINGNSELFGFGIASTLSYLSGANIDKTTKQYGSLVFLGKIVFEPMNDFRDVIGTLLKASSTALSVVTGVYVGTGLFNISEGKNLKESTESVAIASLSYMFGTIALRNLNRCIANK